MTAPQLVTTQGGPDDSAQAKLAREALKAGLGDLDAGMASTGGMILKMVDGTIGWYPARKQVPPLPYMAPVTTTATPAPTGILAALGATVATVNLMLTEHQRLLDSYNNLLTQLAAQGYMVPKPVSS